MTPKLQQEDPVIGCFTDPEDARRAIRMLHDAGFTDEEIGLITRDRHGDLEVTTVEETKGSKAGSGAAIGAAAGAGGGALWALGVAAGVLPAIGPVIAGGLLAAIAASAVGGAAAGGVVGALIGLGVPSDDAEFYEAEFKKGSTIVVVDSKERATSASDILRICGSYNRYEQQRATPAAPPLTQNP